MRNKWFVGGLLLPAVLFTWGAISCLRHDMGIFSIVPAALAIGFYYGAYKVGQANSFSPVPPAIRSDVGTNAALTRWNDERDAREKAAKTAAARTSSTR